MSLQKLLRAVLWLTLATLVLLAGACGGGRSIIKRSDLYDVEMLMPPLRVQSLIGQKPMSQLDHRAAETDYLFLRYNIKVEPDDSAVSSSMGSMTQYSNRMGTDMRVPSTSSTTVVPYFLIFKEGELLFHGLLDEFQSSVNEEVRLLHPKINEWYQSTG